MLEKKRRVVNRALLEAVKIMTCVVCSRRPCDPDHIRSRGAGGGDTHENVWPLCRWHHTERHTVGLTEFARKYLKASLALAERGFEYEIATGRWTRRRGDGGEV